MNYNTLLENIDFFDNFTKEEIASIVPLCKQESHAKDSIIFTEDSPAEKFYLILKGQVKITHQIERVGEEELVVLDNGVCFGEMALMDGGPRSASAIAEMDTKLLVLEKKDIDKLIKSNKDIAVKMLTKFCMTLSARVRDANRQVSDMTGLFISFRTKRIVEP